MQAVSRALLGSIALVAVVGITACQSGEAAVIPVASTAPSTAPSAPPLTPPATRAPDPSPAASVAGTVPTAWTAYTSDRFAYAVDHPTAWAVTPATGDWPNHHPPSPFGPTTDKFGATGDADTFVIITSDPLEADQSAAERIAAIDFINAGEGSGSGCLSADRHTISLGGVDARQEDLTCFGTDYLIEVVVVTHGRIYLLDLFSRPSAISPTDRATFDRFLSSFSYTAAAAS